MNFISQRCRRLPQIGKWQTAKSKRAPAICGLAVLLFTFVFCVLPGAPAQEGRLSEYDVKAAFLFNFGKFVEWPPGAFADGDAPLVIGVLGSDPFHGDLDAIVAGQKIGGRKVAVRMVTAAQEAKGCQILFIPEAAKEQMREALKAVAGASVLTVGEADGFCEAGGMINFVIEHNQVHFDINNGAANAAGLKISSKLLTLARRLPKSR